MVAVDEYKKLEKANKKGYQSWLPSVLLDLIRGERDAFFLPPLRLKCKNFQLPLLSDAPNSKMDARPRSNTAAQISSRADISVAALAYIYITFVYNLCWGYM